MSTSRRSPWGRTTSRTDARGQPADGPARTATRWTLLITGVLVAVLVTVTVAAIVLAARQQSSLASSDPAVVEQQAFPGSEAADQDETGGVVVGEPGAQVLTLYEDFLCPACAQLEAVSGGYLAELEAGTDVTVEYRPIAILDRLSAGSDYSTRSAAAAMCVADIEGDATFRAFVTALFVNQPAEGGPGPDDAALGELATSTGAGPDTEACISEGRFTGWVGRSTLQAQALGVSGTPTIWIDGRPTEARTPEQLAEALEVAP